MKPKELKDAYIAGIVDSLGGEAMAEMGAAENAALAGRLGREVGGEQAGMFVNLSGTPTIIQKNDGNPRLVIADGNRVKTVKDQSAANPLSGRGYGAKSADVIQDSSVINRLSNMLHSNRGGSSEIDRVTMGQPITGPAMADRQYSNAMMTYLP